MKSSILLLAVVLAGAAQAAPGPKPTIYLDGPGVLDGIRRDDPALHDKLARMLQLAQAEPCEKLPRILQAQFEATSVQCRSYQILTSYPPKIRFAFELGGATYVSNVVQPKLAGARIAPAVETVEAK